jgi:pimeloyl-ACP methyl ester carboxylesterase
MNAAGQLLETTTSDGVRLAGFLQQSPESSSNRLALISHGVCGNFYSSSLLDSVCETLHASGVSTLRINNRGRDGIAFHSTNTGFARHGSAYESMADAPLDLAAWATTAKQLGYDHIGAVGHSLGALKTVLWVTENEPQPGPEFLILMSPPRFEPTALRVPSRTKKFETDVATARENIESTRPEAMLKVSHPFPMMITAATFADKYDSGTRWDYVDRLAKISVPTLLTFGEREVTDRESTFRGVETVVRSAIANRPDHQCEVIPNGDHNYTRARRDLCQTISTWLHPISTRTL